MDASLPVAIIGSGFSGTMTALHLLDRARPARLILCERGSISPAASPTGRRAPPTSSTCAPPT
jgi:glycine/D-amino acid oxidase-like deaminating enzyme